MTSTMTGLQPSLGFDRKPATVVSYTGTALGMTREQHAAVTEWLTGLRIGGAIEFHDGDCIGGDAEAFEIASTLGFVTVGHPCDLDDKRAFNLHDRTEPVAAPLTRNRALVAVADVLVAAPRTPVEQRRSGTWATVRYARKAGILRLIVRPDGSTAVGEKSHERG